ncbi:MAG: Mov34/MPN/PAD-1 family protein [Pirellulaceae bacterium]|nr:Mov34/MPN/PAD-1 family protein [Pirellulaceae bacterium]
MNDEIQFGEIEEASPQKILRPDRNKHFAVAPCGTPADGELPIFLDLDVAHDMEMHAQSDKTVELGGVLLGAQCTDDDGKPFVLITDSLRAAHYESTKGSFKFTHDTWSAISRQRDEFPADLQMVGWYHTHPDWGVFLSGMDMFICDNFFNKKLDVAYVIDPCRGDRAMFQWTGDPRQRCRRTGGFYLIASRFRQAELENYVAQLEGKVPDMPAQYTPSGFGTPVINLHQPRDKEPQWQGIAVLGMLSLQFALLALIAWKLLAPAPPAEAKNENVEKLVKRMDKWMDNEQYATQERAKQQAYSQIVTELKGAPPGYAEKLEREAQELELLRSQQPRVIARENELEVSRKEAEDQATHLSKVLGKRDDQIASLLKERDEQKELLKAAKKESDKAEEGDPKPEDYTIWWVIGGTAVAITLGTTAFFLLKKPTDDIPPEGPEPASPTPAVEKSKSPTSEAN